MSSSDQAAAADRSPFRRLVVAGAMALLLGIAAGCTVRPLYGDASAGSGLRSAPSAALASVDVKPAGNRVGQEVRNHLIFLLGGGSGRPASPAYSLDLTATPIASQAASISTNRVSLEPTSGIMTVRANYRLTETATGRVISSGIRSAQAPYDIPSQEFAALRALRNAENRASRELAELLRLVIAQELEKPTSTAAPVVISSPEEIADTARRPATFSRQEQ